VVLLALAGMILAAGALALQEQEQTKKAEERFSANVLLWAAGPMTGKTGRLTMSVERWTTDEEKAALLKALTEGGSDALLKAMRKTIVGYTWTTRTLRYRVNIASSLQTEKGRVIRLVTERPISFVEAWTATRSRDYEFGVIEFTLDAEGKGDGILIPTAKVTLNKEGQIEVETLGIGPQKLLSVKKD
jgi:frataxin-like iron-binding protein CyaY